MGAVNVEYHSAGYTELGIRSHFPTSYEMTLRMFKDRKGPLRTPVRFARFLKRLHIKRRESRADNLKTRGPRRSLTASERESVLEKTAGRCHICGDEIRPGEKWSADHILAYAHGGKHTIANYLAAHQECNGYRRHFGPEEFAWILKLGVWFRSQIAAENPDALVLAEKFVKHHASLKNRRVTRDDA